MELPFDKWSHFWEYILKIPEHKLETYVPLCSYSIIYNSQDLEPAQVPSEWKKAVIHLHSGILLIHNKEGTLATAWMHLEIIMLSEISQLVKDKYHMILMTCGI